ncbi:MAG: gas vesicle protein GvpD P-loop domain-containing protein [Thermoplasmata archaeon]
MEYLRLPEELNNFFEGVMGRSLIIKGNAGTGKTIMSLSIIEKIGSLDNSFYLSTRVTNEALYSQFEWLKEKDWRSSLIDASMDFLKSVSKSKKGAAEFKTRKSEELDKLDKARKVLKEMRSKKEVERKLPEHVSRNMLVSLEEEEKLSEIEDLYDKVEGRLPDNSFVVIDSIEAIIERYGIKAKKLIKTLQKDLVEWSGVKLILISEKKESMEWDYLVDGVVTLNEEEFKGRRSRDLYLNKLRGVRIERPSYLFSLEDGKFQYFPPIKYHTRKPMLTPNSIDENLEGLSGLYEDFYSSGSKKLDEILGGGYPKNSIVLIEVDDTVPFYGQMNLLGLVGRNFLTKGNGILNISSEARRPDKRDICSWFRQMVPDVGEKACQNFKIKGTTSLEDLSEAYKEVKYFANEPILTITNWEGVEHSVAKQEGEIPKIANGLLDLMSIHSDLNIGIVRPGLEIAQKLRNIAEVHLKLVTKYNTLLMYGEKPNTMIYNVNVKEGEEGPDVVFDPLV